VSNCESDGANVSFCFCDYDFIYINGAVLYWGWLKLITDLDQWAIIWTE